MEERRPQRYTGIPGEWKYVKILASGGQGQISVFMKPCGTLIAVKKFNKESFDEERFKRSLDIFSRLEHSKYVMQIEAHGVDGECHWYATRYYERGSLLRKWFEEIEAATIIYKISLTLVDAHEAGIVHRDIKPANIVMNDDNEPILIDWDISKAKDHAPITLLGHPIGTLTYMAPEQLRGLPPSPSMDIYSLGVTFEDIVEKLSDRTLKNLISDMKSDPEKRPSAEQVANRIKAYLERKAAGTLQQMQTQENSAITSVGVAVGASVILYALFKLFNNKKNQNDEGRK